MMKTMVDATGAVWTATAHEERTPRHHGRWYLVFEAPDGSVLPMPEVRWQTRATAQRTLLAMSDFELLRRLQIVRERALLDHGASPRDGATPTSVGARVNVNAG
jgi:hypothetical protein